MNTEPGGKSEAVVFMDSGFRRNDGYVEKGWRRRNDPLASARFSREESE
jgi:hypothetical protein